MKTFKLCRQHMKNYSPKANDLIIFTNTTSAILSEYSINHADYTWSDSLVTVDPNQSALIIDRYTVTNKHKASLKNTPPSLHTTSCNINKPSVHNPPTILVISLNNLLLEVLYDPDLIVLFPHPSNLIPDIKPSTYLIMAI